MISLIAAMDRNGLLADGMHIPWQGELPTDAAYWCSKARGHTVVMGAKNYQSLGGPLEGSRNIVMSREPLKAPLGVVVAGSFEDAQKLLNPAEETFVLGGGQIFKLFLPLADRMYLTHIDAEFKGDIYFPAWDPKEWRVTHEEPHMPNGQDKYRFTFRQYDRLKSS